MFSLSFPFALVLDGLLEDIGNDQRSCYDEDITGVKVGLWKAQDSKSEQPASYVVGIARCLVV